MIALNRGKFEDEQINEAKRELGMPDIPMEVYPRPQAIPSDSSYFKFLGMYIPFWKSIYVIFILRDFFQFILIFKIKLFLRFCHD